MEAYLDEALPAEQMARIEQLLREDAALLGQLAAINARRDAGVHSLGEIWRRHRLSCLTREQWEGYRQGTLDAHWARYATFHLEVLGCRVCQANLADIAGRHAEPPAPVESRRRRFFQSSAGYLRGPGGKRP
jgi:hypothetical protein